ncbi:hypothetical protein GYMLUDRAFT_93692 [Collybiopsis luxurians FD-317 M1]|nr:hypothetical protein GYMLUDRAFT_93692 [Collybiopsis luxurians FD-317 M1]
MDRVSNSLPSPGLDNKIFVSGYVGMTFAAFTTILRLTLRIRYFGWDDVFAGLALVSLALAAAAGKTFFGLDASSTMPQSSRVALYYVIEVNFDIAIWITRLSILSTIIRLGWYRKQLYTAAGCFVLIMLFLVAQVFWVCESRNRQDHWKEEPSPLCIGVASITITQVATDGFADIILVGAPFFLLRYLKSEDAKSQKLRLSVSFIVGGLTTFVSIVRAVFALSDDEISLLVSNVQLSASVTIANFAVLVAAFHRFWKSVRSSSKRSNCSNDGAAESKLSTIVYGAPPSDLEHGVTSDPDGSWSLAGSFDEHRPGSVV